MSFCRALVACGVLFTALAAPATAMTVWIDQKNPNNPFGNTNERWFLNQNVSHTIGNNVVVNPRYRSGMFRLTLDDDLPSGPNKPIHFNAFCIDLLDELDLPKQYEVVRSPFGAPTTARISALVSNTADQFNPSPNRELGSIRASAFQIALWEIISDSDLDFKNGNFRLREQSGDAVTESRKLAREWLDKIAGNIWKPGDVKFSFFKAEGSQDLTGIALEIVPIPLPAGLLLIGTGLVGFAALRRRPA